MPYYPNWHTRRIYSFGCGLLQGYRRFRVILCPLINLLPFFFRNLNQVKYVPELAYHGLYLLCSPIHGEGDKVKEKKI